MKYVQAVAGLLALLSLSGCGDSFKMGEAVSDGGAHFSASPHSGNDMPEDKSKSAASNYMAYEHSVYLELKEDRVSPVYEVALAACRDAAAEQCTVLESRLVTGISASATLKFRARPAGIKKIQAALADQGGVKSQTMSAEDLAQPISDTSKKLEMLRDYRAKLEGLRGRASTNIESLIKVNKELAQVQSDIEALTGEKAHLLQRVETEILNVNISSSSERPFWRPIGHSLSRFGSNLSDALGSAITAIAYIIPWAPFLFGLAWLTRKLWLRLRRTKAGHSHE